MKTSFKLIVLYTVIITSIVEVVEMVIGKYRKGSSSGDSSDNKAAQYKSAAPEEGNLTDKAGITDLTDKAGITDKAEKASNKKKSRRHLARATSLHTKN